MLLVGGVGGWAATSNLAGAVIASGTVVVEANLKKVQHPTGGVVGETPWRYVGVRGSRIAYFYLARSLGGAGHLVCPFRATA